MAKISVALATFNGSLFIKDQLDSILQQISNDSEVLIGDDDSSDSTLEIINSYNDPRIKLIKNKKRIGYIKNFENLLNRCTGDIIFLSDQDDIWQPNKVKRLTLALQDFECVCSDAVVIDANGEVISDSYWSIRRPIGFSCLSLLLKPSVIGATVALRRSFLKTALPFPDEVPHDLWLSCLAARRHRLGIVDASLICYRRHGNNQSSTATSGHSERAFIERVIERYRLIQALWSSRIGK